MKLGTTYICVEDMEKSLNFYKLLLQKEPLYCNDDRWIAFDCGNQLALYNKKYDEKLLRESKDIHFNQAYIDNFFAEDNYKKNNIVIFNFEVDDLRSEYQRIVYTFPGWLHRGLLRGSQPDFRELFLFRLRNEFQF